MARHLTPTYDALGRRALEASVINVDETRWAIIGSPKPAAGTVWGVHAPGVSFDRILPGMSAEEGREVLANYHEIVVVDGFAVYEVLARDGPVFTLGHCWAYTKRTVRRDRGLAAQVSRLPMDALDADAVCAFLLSRIANRSTGCSRLGERGAPIRAALLLAPWGDVAGPILRGPMVRTYRQSTVPAVLSAEEVQRLLATPDRAPVRGRRDAAMLLPLARLVLRASEIVFLEVGDLRWRAGEIVIRGKGPQRDHIPLLADVGDALVRYLQHGRGPSPSRPVFLRLIPPRVGLARRCAIDHIVRLAFSRRACLRAVGAWPACSDTAWPRG